MPNDELKNAAKVVISKWKDEFKALEQNERDFVDCIHDILFDIRYHIENPEEHHMQSTYEFPGTLKTLIKAMEKYQTNHHILSCIQSWSKGE